MRFFEKTVEQLAFGDLLCGPQRVYGGYMHRMFSLETTTGKYAIKLLNPSIMQQDDALENFKQAEALEQLLEENEIPIVSAIRVNGKKMHCIGNQYFYVYHWHDGRSLEWSEITKAHCEIAGTLLAKINKIQQAEALPAKEYMCIDWDMYIEEARRKCPEIAEELARNQEVFMFGEAAYNDALKMAPAVSGICNCDMDCKNILWIDNTPTIIDLECLSYGNPFLEMFVLALSWAGGVVCQIDYERLHAFITAYMTAYGNQDVNCKEFYGIGFSWLDWLEYNVKRALGIACQDDEERKLGVSQVYETITRIVYYDKIKDDLLNSLDGMHMRLQKA